jgi:glycerol-3-phosphate acyltransferase PlsY
MLLLLLPSLLLLLLLLFLLLVLSWRYASRKSIQFAFRLAPIIARV